MKKPLSLLLALHLSFGSTGLGAQTLNESFDSTTPLTDQEQDQANNYFHQGIAGDYLKEECGKLNKEFKTQLGCDDKSGAPGQVLGGSLGGILEEMIPRLYGMMGMVTMASGGGKVRMKTGEVKEPVKDASGKVTEPGSDGIEEKKDVCIYIPMAGELVAQITQKMEETNIQNQMTEQKQQNSLADQQKESLYAVANVHKTRAKTANMQGTIFASTAACYAAYLVKGGAFQGFADKSAIFKMGAAGLVSYIYFAKAKKHKNYAEAVRNVAKNLPGDGECNPFTKTQCFCSESTSQKVDPTNYAKVCVPKELANNGNTNPNAIPCSTIQGGKAVVDLQCSCKRNNSCLNGQLVARAASIDFGGVNMADPLRLLNEMNGSFDQERIEPIVGSINARNKSLMGKLPVGDIPSVSLNDKNRQLAKELNRIGMPARAAAAAAAANIAPVNPSSLASSGSIGSLPELGEDSSYNSKAKGYNSSYSGSGSSRRSNQMPAFNNPLAKGEKRDAVQIETFAEQALAQAEITKDTSVGIFDLISNRYRRSAWNKFELEKQMQKEATSTSPSSESE